MQLAVRKSGDVTVIAVSGTITMLDSPSPLKQQVTRLVQEGARKFVLSLGELTFVDSSCVGELVSCYVRVARADGTLKLYFAVENPAHVCSASAGGCGRPSR